jgi:hypothetical protein
MNLFAFIFRPTVPLIDDRHGPGSGDTRASESNERYPPVQEVNALSKYQGSNAEPQLDSPLFASRVGHRSPLDRAPSNGAFLCICYGIHALVLTLRSCGAG